MASLKVNIAANLTGKGYTAAISFFFIPVYVNFLGIESFGLIGFVNTLYAIAGLFDAGLSTTVTRELARISTTGSAALMRDLVRTMELPYWGLATALGTAILFGAPWIADRWIASSELPVSVVHQALALGGVYLAFQMPLGLYSGGLLGLQRQVLLNAIQVVSATVRHIGAALLLWRVSDTILVYLVWQIAVTAGQAAATMLALWRHLPASPHRARFKARLLLQSWRFAIGMTSITLMSALIQQTDKIILSAMLPLGMFGYYTAAATMASSLSIAIAPIFTSVFPRFAQLVFQRDQAELRKLFHKCSQLISALILPLSTVIAFFPREVLFAWTHNLALADNGASSLRVLIVGAALNGLIYVPYTLALSVGMTSIILAIYLISLALIVPLIYWLASCFGGVGGAIGITLFHLGSLVALTPVVVSRQLPGELQRWCLADVLLPLTTSLMIVVGFRWSFPGSAGLPMSITVLAAAFLSAAAACVLALSWPRSILFQAISRHIRISSRADG